MRLAATGLLLAMALLFIAARLFLGRNPVWEWLLAFSEAAMVGGLADWFAVTALFRHPLGLPIPHTAIVPENKDRIADSMAIFLRQNFLTPQVVARRLKAMNLAGAAGQYLMAPQGGEDRLRLGLLPLAADILQSLDPEQLGGLVKRGLAHQLERLDLAPLLGQMLGAAIADGRHGPVLESLIRWAALTLEANEALIRGLIHDRANAVLRWTGLDERLATGILDGIYRLLAETIVTPDHPLRAKVEEGLSTLAEKLRHDPAMQAKVAELKQELLANPAMAAWLDGLWEKARAALLQAARNPEAALSGPLGASVTESIAGLGTALQRDAHLQRLVNRFARRTLTGIAARHGDQIVRLVSETVKRWDASTVTARLEGAVGRDLQFIRINGTLVGGSVGVLIHAVTLLV